MIRRMSGLQRLLSRLELNSPQADVFVGGAGWGSATVGDRLFGGMVAAQAVRAAQRSVESKSLHALHALFLRPGRAGVDIRFEVTRTKEGRNYHVRSVAAYQDDERIFQCEASFSSESDGVRHQDPMPEAPDPEQCRNRDELRGREGWRDLPLDIRVCDPLTGSEPLPPSQRLWIRSNGKLPDDAELQRALLVYASDRSLLDTAWRPHAASGLLYGASLDHSVWLHAPVRLDEWNLYVMHSSVAAGGRGLSLGAIYHHSGVRVASVAQEGVLRLA